MTDRNILLEICVDGPEMALEAWKAGADRIELCTALETGGITPSLGAIRETVTRVPIPVHVLVRPRAGDFLYSDAEFRVMCSDIDAIRESGAAGIVAGVLLPDGRIDSPRTRLLIERASPLSFTFHRAFDFVSDPFVALEDLCALGVDRILTSGLRNSASEGAELLAVLIRKAGERLVVMPGAGINHRNVAELLRTTKAREIHMSARKPIEGGVTCRPDGIELGGDAYRVWVADAEKIIQVRQRSFS
jgi:copper homeostasis protein